MSGRGANRWLFFALLGVCGIGLLAHWISRKAPDSQAPSDIVESHPSPALPVPLPSALPSARSSMATRSERPGPPDRRDPQNEAQKNFAEMTSRALQQLPTVDDLRQLTSEEAHHTPRLIQRAGATLGAIAQALQDNPALAPQALKFYRDCSQTEKFPSSIRALCYADERNLTQQHTELQGDPHASDIPPEVKDLAAKVPNATH